MAKVAFVQKNINENLGVMYLSSYLKRSGHRTECFIELLERDLIRAVREYAPDVIGFTVMSGTHRWCIETARRLKCQDNLIVFGGPHPTFFPEVIREPAVDAVCIGEGEQPMLELADSFPDLEKMAGIRNLHVKVGDVVVKNELRDLVADLDDLPFPDRELFYKYDLLRKNSRKTVITSRGCPYSCAFCFNAGYRRLYAGKGRYVRRRSVDNVLAEILEVKRNFPLKSVFFQDDTFVLDRDWIRDFADQYRRRVTLPFTCFVRADLMTEEVAEALKKAGCVCVHFGIESGSEHIRNEVLKKGVSDAQISETARLLKGQGIRFKTYNMLRLPGETVEEAFEKTVKMNSTIGTDYPWSSIMCPYPRTDLVEYLVRQGDLARDYAAEGLPATFFNLVKPERRDWPFVNLQRLFFYAVKFPSATPLIQRMIHLRPNPLFDLLFLLAHGYNYKGSENMSWGDVIRFGIKSWRTIWS